MSDHLHDSSAIEDFSGLKFPPDTVEYALFEGTEAEGPYTGSFTLFVVGDVDPLIIEQQCACSRSSGRPYQQIYLGAGGRFDYNPVTVRTLYDLNLTPLTVENPVVDWSLMRDIKTLTWIIPLVWHGQSVAVGQASAEQSLTSTADIRNRVVLKIDTGNSVFAARAADVHYTSYGSYGADTLLLKKER